MGKIIMGTYKFMMGTYKFMMGTYKFMMGTYKFIMGTYKFNKINCTCFGSTYTKIGTIQRRLAWKY
jgi:hypothetical protein